MMGEVVAFSVDAGNETGLMVTWDFGDGDDSHAMNALHTYEQAGVYDVSVTISGEGIREAQGTFVIPVASERPVEESPDTVGQGATTDSTPPAAISQMHPEIQVVFDRLENAIANSTSAKIQGKQVNSIWGLQVSGGTKEFSVNWRHSEMLDNDTFFEVNGKPYQRPWIRVYEGEVAGNEQSIVRLTMTDNWARGSVRTGDDTYLIRIRFDGNVPLDVGARPLPAEEGKAPSSPEPNGCPGDLQAWVPHLIEPATDSGRSTWDPLWVQLILDGDGMLVSRLGLDSFGMMIAITAEMDSIYDHEVAIRHHIVGVHLHTDKASYPSPEGNIRMHDVMATYWGLRSGWDIVHLMTGHTSSFAEANCIGSAGTQFGYTFTPFPWEEQYAVFHTNAYAHELGHIYSAHHHYGNHAESTLATIMIQGYTPGDTANFSTLSKSVIRGWAEEYID